MGLFPRDRFVAGGNSAFAANDVIKTVKGDKIEGKIRRITPTEVTIKELAGPEKVPVNEISSITFAEDPAPLKGVRVNVNKDNEQFEEALKNLSKIKVNTIERTEIKQDIDYYRAYCEARLALLGTGNVVEAGKKWRPCNRIPGQLPLLRRLWNSRRPAGGDQ